MQQRTSSVDIQTIREALEANSRLTSLSGAALLVSGLLCFLSAGLTSQSGLAESAARSGLGGPVLRQMVLVWSATLLASIALNLLGMLRRARLDGQPLAARLGRRVLFAMLPALAVGGALTLALALQGSLGYIFAVWMLCYGAALIAASAHSLTSVRMLGMFTLMGGVLGVLGLDLDFLVFVATFGAGHFLLGVWVGVRYGW
ncbi:MAG: hypothetical protein KF696_07755 [Planctomycetes bacterium]|nr:hypothetical protein [Planctomycetota bacterium]MCW8135447.1 hypothetical protein [Planctomycetota bacterium]